MFPINERFENAVLDARLRWLNPPPAWRLDPSVPALTVEPGPATDFWQRTHYGFRADNGHFLYARAAGDFCIATELRFHPRHRYDQAGLMVRVDADCWVKASVEHEPEGSPKLGSVVTNYGYSDWALQDFPANENALRLRIRRQANDLLIDFGRAGAGGWTPIRVAHLHCDPGRPADAGIYACSPKGAGFRVEFQRLDIEAPAGQ